MVSTHSAAGAVVPSLEWAWTKVSVGAKGSWAADSKIWLAGEDASWLTSEVAERCVRSRADERTYLLNFQRGNHSMKGQAWDKYKLGFLQNACRSVFLSICVPCVPRCGYSVRESLGRGV